ncbi:MAG TPA: hypothetical protein VMS77_04295 [Conexivisphaerales archaeon]|nr:hypothetical protein [Conexivisphaerales archaeon]
MSVASSPSSGQEFQPVSFEDGIIGKFEHFITDRWEPGRMWSRAIPTALVSMGVAQVELSDRMGVLKPNMFFVNISPSGTGKSPPLRLGKHVMKRFEPTYPAPGKFTPPGFTQRVLGLSMRNGQQVQGTPHPYNLIASDEMSKLLGLSKGPGPFSENLEFFSELWDGEIEGQITRTYGYEGSVPVYASLMGASSDLFLSRLEDDFFIQGTGNRILFMRETVNPKDINGDEFFFPLGRDPERENLIEDTVQKLKFLQSCRGAIIMPADIWAEYRNRIARQAAAGGATLESSYLIKMPENALKLAINYAASRLSVRQDQQLGYMVNVFEEDMRRAIEDIETYNELRKKVLDAWREVRYESRRRPMLPTTSDYELGRMVMLSAKPHGWLMTRSSVQGDLDLANPTEVNNILAAGVAGGYLEEISDPGKELTREQYIHFKHRGGPYPQVFKVTEKGVTRFD